MNEGNIFDVNISNIQFEIRNVVSVTESHVTVRCVLTHVARFEILLTCFHDLVQHVVDQIKDMVPTNAMKLIHKSIKVHAFSELSCACFLGDSSTNCRTNFFALTMFK